jgi:hypothetical protein
LDFCDSYYKPPEILKINKTVERMLDWQRPPRQKSGSARPLRIDEFMIAVTCRLDQTLPHEARERLIRTINSNCEESATYREQFSASRPGDRVDEWAESEHLDFFLASWPKEIARIAAERQWNMEIVDYVHYSRGGDSTGEPYEMVCLVCLFKRTELSTTYLDVALKALDRNSRTQINSVNRDEEDGRGLLEDLTGIVELRNLHAEHRDLERLPNPMEEIRRKEAEGVHY